MANGLTSAVTGFSTARRRGLPPTRYNTGHNGQQITARDQCFFVD